jgi:hypothetical protein
VGLSFSDSEGSAALLARYVPIYGDKGRRGLTMRNEVQVGVVKNDEVRRGVRTKSEASEERRRRLRVQQDRGRGEILFDYQTEVQECRQLSYIRMAMQNIVSPIYKLV